MLKEMVIFVIGEILAAFGLLVVPVCATFAMLSAIDAPGLLYIPACTFLAVIVGGGAWWVKRDIKRKWEVLNAHSGNSRW